MNVFKRNGLISLASTILLVIISACEENKEIQTLTGQLVGFVELIGEVESSGVEIEVSSGDFETKVTTNEKGQFIIDDLESGSYNVTFNKEGFLQYKIFGHQFVGGGQPTSLGTHSLFPEVDCQIQNLQVTAFEEPYHPSVMVTADAMYSDEDLYPSCCVYLSGEPDVSYQNYSTTYWERLYKSGEFSLGVYVDTLQFPVGSELYMIMYPCWGVYNDYYTDFESGSTIYRNVNINQPSNVAHITVPEF